jgi:uncharacterized surface protein with fasciclin (FAS1) repeats
MKKTNLMQKFSKAIYALLIMTAVSFTFTACDDTEDAEPAPEDSILEIVASSDNHTQLDFFLKKYPNLVTVLEGNGPFTLFAPNDGAFASLKVILGVESLESVNAAVIEGVLAFHVHSGLVLRSEMTSETSLTTAQGEAITFNGEGNIATGGSNPNVLFGAEILATNGVVQVVETILIPPTVFATIGANLGKVSQTVLLGADFSTLSAAIFKADTYATAENTTLLTAVLAGTDEVTVFAPINAVFAGAGITLETFTAEQWYGIILTHVVSGNFSAEALGGALAQGNNTLTTLAQTNVQVAPASFQDTPTLSVGGAPVVAADIISSNGRVHAIAGIVSSVNKYTAVLLGGQGNDAEGFYNAFSNVKYGYAAARDASGVDGSPVDFAYYFGSTNNATIASIDDAGLNAVYTSVDLSIADNFGTRNSTKFRVTDLAPAQFDGILLDSQLATAGSSENNTNTSATDLQVGSVVAFTLDADRGGYVGLLKVVSLDDTNGNGTITIEVKVQVEGN